MAHLFSDGTIKTSAEMHAENNRRREEDQRLKMEEDRFPKLGQTAARRQAMARMMARIEAARRSETMTSMANMLEKQNAEQEYNQVLRNQRHARAAAAQAAAKRH